MSLKSTAAALSGELKATPEYAGLKAAKAAIDRNRSLKTEVEELRRKQSVLYSSRLPARDAEARINELNKQISRLSEIPEFMNYMKASEKFSQILNETIRMINQSIEEGLR